MAGVLEFEKMFPAPREVDKELYMLRFQFTDPVHTEFSAPTEADRESYTYRR